MKAWPHIQLDLNYVASFFIIISILSFLLFTSILLEFFISFLFRRIYNPSSTKHL